MGIVFVAPDRIIAVVALPNMIRNRNDFLPFLNLNLICHNVASEEDAPGMVDKAINEGAQVVLGGAITTRIARDRGLPAILLESGEASIRLALQEAKRIVCARWLEARRSNELKAMLDSIAQSVTGIPQEEALGSRADRVIPSIRLSDALQNGSQDLGDLIDLGDSRIMVNRIPIRVEGDVVGAVATFQDITKIQSMEERIRREICSKGHAAKFRFVDIYGSSTLLTEAIDAARQYVQVDSTVLIHGETGVGKDLFWRLNVLSLPIPPLRERRDDIMPLVWDFLDALFPSDRRRFVFSEDAPPFLTRHPWPGNVRELRNLCERLTVVRTGRTVDAAFLTHLLEYRESERPPRSGPGGTEEIERALSQAGGRIGRAAEILGVHRATLWRKCKRLSRAKSK